MAPACECAVCYSETGPFRKLACSHEFCGSCIKQWYLKGTGAGCPMCRRPIHFKGFAHVRAEWDEEHWRNKCLEVIDEARVAAIEEAFEWASAFVPRWRHLIMNELMEGLLELERTAHFLMAEGIDSDWLAFVLFETDDYYSDRHLGKCKWSDEPVKQLATRYPKMAKSGAKGARRARARPDLMSTFVFLIEV